MKLLVLLFAILLSSPAVAEIIPVVNPQEVTAEIRVTADTDLIKDKIWNRWTTQNFVVCSLSDSQAKYLHDHLEEIKTWLYQRWGFYDIPFKSECKLICVDDPELFKKLFRLDHSSVEIRRNADGSIKESVVFLLLNDTPARTLPMALTEVCLAEFEQEYKVKFGWWVHRGMALLNGTLANVRKNIEGQIPLIQKQEPMFFSRTLLETTEEEYKAFYAAKKAMFDRTAMLMCLMLKKEFGTTKFQEMMKGTAIGETPETAVKAVLAFGSYDDLDASFKRYMKDLIEDVANRKTPDEYLQIEVR